MKILREFEIIGQSGVVYPVKDYEYDYNDAEIIKEHYSHRLNPETVNNLCNWLKENSKTIVSKACYDPSLSIGHTFQIDNIDLSCNGFCLGNSSVETFINGGEYIHWYKPWTDKYKELKQINDVKEKELEIQRKKEFDSKYQLFMGQSTYIPTKLLGKWGVVNKDGEEVTEFKYTYDEVISIIKKMI